MKFPAATKQQKADVAKRNIKMVEAVMQLPDTIQLDDVKKFFDDFSLYKRQRDAGLLFFGTIMEPQSIIFWNEDDLLKNKQLFAESKEIHEYNKNGTTCFIVENKLPEALVIGKLINTPLFIVEQHLATEHHYSDKLCMSLNLIRNDIKKFFLKCAKDNEIDKNKLNQALNFVQLQSLQQLPMLTVEEDNNELRFAPMLPNRLKFELLEAKIIKEVFLEPIAAGMAKKIWLKTAICPTCEKFFFYNREGTKFCSDKCRMRATFQRRKDNIK